MKGRVPEPESLFSAAQAPEVFDRPRNDVGPEQHDDAAHRRLADLDVEVHLRVLARLLQLRLKRNNRNFKVKIQTQILLQSLVGYTQLD